MFTIVIPQLGQLTVWNLIYITVDMLTILQGRLLPWRISYYAEKTNMKEGISLKLQFLEGDKTEYVRSRNSIKWGNVYQHTHTNLTFLQHRSSRQLPKCFRKLTNLLYKAWSFKYTLTEANLTHMLPSLLKSMAKCQLT